MKKFHIKYRTSKKEYREVLITAIDKDSAAAVVMRDTNSDLGDSVIESIEQIKSNFKLTNSDYSSK